MLVPLVPQPDRIEAMQAAMQAKTGERVPVATAEAVLAEFERLVGGVPDFSPSPWVGPYRVVRGRASYPDDQTGAEVRARAEFG